MSIHKPPIIKRPIKVRNNGSQKIVYRVIKDIQHLKNNPQVGTATIKGKSYMVRNQGVYWVVV
ncbi:hypothetical protein FNW02_36835 [Komarekiella sp. 'clone 1']|uniref:Uncharacterized protein n=1 Tax=Komarekiella delphini-convector SJRDD-AB1 TaxID=2593771 RepID=A0AA41BAD3_9NOST|nr:hypothetical protein [Komarekiella delphini-convector]MBD6621130.1 hypothetical protein [Komarekiella delphini-convector SJRDD-AB1]